MIVVRGTDHWEAMGLSRPVVTIGNFDGVHRGHQALIAATKAVAGGQGPATVLTFDPAPRDVLRPDNGIPRIQSFERKLVHLHAAGVDAVVVQPFDAALAALSPEAFAKTHLIDALGARGVCVGHDFRFGKGRAGTVETLRSLLDVDVETVPPLTDPDGPVSSSRIRAALARGELPTANALLGRPHELVGVVVPGDQRGRTLGFPTANLDPRGGIVPPNGVYAVRVEIDGVDRDGVANLGLRPTFGEGDRPRLEIHLLAPTGELYGRTLVAKFVARLRDEQRFDGVQALVAQIRLDITQAREVLG